MNKSLLALALAFIAIAPAHAQGFQDEPTCYSWNGGHKSAGSFSKCNHWPVVVAAAPPPAVVPAPVMQASPVCPPQIILEPEKPKARHYKPRPKPVCKP